MTIRFLADYYYDYADPLRTAELLSDYTDEASLSRQADALWLSGHGDTARNLWTILASPGDPVQTGAPPDTLIRSLYNLAAGSSTALEELTYLEQLRSWAPDHRYGLIRYSRLLATSEAIALLEAAASAADSLIDLELLRRRQDTWLTNRVTPETWLLLDRYPGDPDLYQWGAYYFDHQKQYAETAQLLRTAGFNNIDEPWMKLHGGLGLIMRGELNAAEELFRSTGDTGVWQIPANLARILEAKRSTAAALEYYEIAASQVTGSREAARIQLRIARCLRTLGRGREVRRVLEYALSLDSENLNIRLELQRQESLEAF
jgi:tetratricopeptide (TPR) repeat protein